MLVDHVMVRWKKVKCNNLDINEVPGCLMDFMHDCIDLSKNEKLDDLKDWLVPLILYMILRWLGVCASIEKKDLDVAARY